MTRIRNPFAYFLFCIKHKKIRAFSLFINIIVLILSLFDIKRILSYPIAIAILLLLLNILWQIISIFNEVVQCFKFERLDECTSDEVKSDMVISEKEKQRGFDFLSVFQGIAIFSDTLNKYLQAENESGCRIEKSKSVRVKQYINMHFELLFMFLKCRLQDANSKRFRFFNEKKLCLADDIDFINGSPVNFCMGNYYYYHITNRIHFEFIKDKNGWPYNSPLYEEYGSSLPDISSSKFCNQIGVSTIGFTCDGYIVLLEQCSKANASSGLLVPTCSGSVNWTDYRDNQFFKTIKYATKRELYEECGKIHGKTPDTIAKVKILGFFIWVNYGGQPQFVSISTMHVKSSEINPLDNEQTKNKTQSEYVFYKDEYNNKKTINIDVIKKFLDKVMLNKKCSFPLYMNIYLLLKYIKNSKAEFEQFLLNKNLSE